MHPAQEKGLLPQPLLQPARRADCGVAVILKSGKNPKSAALIPEAFRGVESVVVKAIEVLMTNGAWSLPNTADILSVGSDAFT